MPNKEPAGRIAESIDFEEVNRQVDDLVQTAVGMLKDPSRGGIISASGKAPQYNPVDLSGVRDELTSVKSRRDATNLQITESQNILAETTTSKKEAIAAAATAEADKIKADQARATQEALIYSELAFSMGIRPDDIAEVAVKMREERLVAEAMLGQIQEMQSVGLLDDPIQWVANQIQLPSIIEPYNRQADKVNAIQETLDQSIATAARTADFNVKAIPATTAAQAKAAADLVAARGKIAQLAAEEELAKQNITFATQKLSNDLAIMTATINTSQLELQQNIQSYQSQIRAIDNAENNATRLLKAAELLEKLEKTKGLDVILANYDRIVGHPKGTTTRYNFERFGENQKVNIIAIGAGSGGSNPLEAMINFSMARPGPEASPQSIRVNEWLQEKVAGIGADINVQRLDEKQKPLEMSRRLKAQIEMEKDLAYRPGNLFHELSPAEMIASGNVPADTRLAKVLQPFTNQPGPVATELIAAAIRKEFPSMGEAAVVLSDYYRKNISLRNLTSNYTFFKINPPVEYKVPMMARGYGNLFTGKLDLTNPADAAKYLIFMEIRDKTKKLGYTPSPFDVVPYGDTSNFMQMFSNPEDNRSFKDAVNGNKVIRNNTDSGGESGKNSPAPRG